MALRDYLAGEVAEDFSDGLLTRREALRRLGLLGLTVGAASALLAACGDGGSTAPAPAQSAPASGPPGGASPPGRGPGAARAAEIHIPGPAGELRAAWALPAATPPGATGPAGVPPKGAVLVIHENGGLTKHFFDVVGRLAGTGYAALCVDLLSSQGGTNALTDPAQAPTALAAKPVESVVAELRAGIDALTQRAPGRKVGAVGFCFGGGMTWQLLQAGETRLAAAAPFYGPAPDQPDFRRAKAAVLAVYAGLDNRVNASRERAEAALRTAGLVYQVRTFDGADHAFFNDTGARYSQPAAEQAWTALLDWFTRYLG